MKSAQEILKKNITGYRGSIKQSDAVRAMIEYAKAACEEQREICAKEADYEYVGPSYHQVRQIDPSSIVNASEPELP